MARVQRRRLEDYYKKMDDRESGNRLEGSRLSSDLTRGKSASQKDGGINMLPDEILVLILSSLSLKEAMATSLLSSRWKNLWMFTSKLDLHIDFLETSKRMGNIERDKLLSMFVKWFDRLYTRLQLVKPYTNLVEFSLSFHLYSSFATWIDDWLSYVVSRKVERLDLIFVAYQDEKRYSFPYNEGNFPANLKLLKKLSLHYVNVSGEVVAFILGNCGLLELLSLHQTGALSSLEVVGTSPLFKCLEISECTSLKSVVVRGSELVCIKYNGVGNRARCRFLLVDVPLLTQLWIQAEPYFPDLIAMLDMFEPVLPQLQTLKIYSTFIISHGLHFVAKIMPNLKQFVVVLLGSDYSDKCSLMPWFSVVSSPCLQRFVVEASHYATRKNRFIKSSTFNHHSSFGNGDPAGRRRTFGRWGRYQIPNSYSQIKEVEFVGYCGMSNQFQMIKHFVQYGTALDKIIVDPRSFEQSRHMLSDRIYGNHTEDEILARNRARDQFKDSRINVTIL